MKKAIKTIPKKHMKLVEERRASAKKEDFISWKEAVKKLREKYHI